MPPFDGRVLVPSVSGTIVGGEVGSSETIMPGASIPGVSAGAVIWGGSPECERSGAMTVASASPDEGGAILENSLDNFLRSSSDLLI